MCHYSRPWKSSNTEVIFLFLFWFIYKWIEVWSNSQYCAALKIKADLFFTYTYTYTFKYINIHIYWVYCLVLICYIVQTFFFLCWFSLPPHPRTQDAALFGQHLLRFIHIVAISFLLIYFYIHYFSIHFISTSNTKFGIFSREGCWCKTQFLLVYKCLYFTLVVKRYFAVYRILD